MNAVGEEEEAAVNGVSFSSHAPTLRAVRIAFHSNCDGIKLAY
jgi:hypothetical protein